MGRKLTIAALVGLLVAGSLAAAWYLVIRDDAPERVSLEAALDDAQDGTAESQPTVTAGAPASETPGAGVDGTWVVDGAAESFVGYRVEEELARVGAQTAVGRTGEVTGTLEIEGTRALVVEMEADLSTLRSDSSNRDRQMRSQALETNQFPTATFALTQPIDFGVVPVEGQAVSADATGDLTIHGVTREVTVPVEAQLTGGRILVVGSIPIAFADYDIDTPTSFAILSIEDHGEMEFQLFFTR